MNNLTMMLVALLSVTAFAKPAGDFDRLTVVQVTLEVQTKEMKLPGGEAYVVLTSNRDFKDNGEPELRKKVGIYFKYVD